MPDRPAQIPLERPRSRSGPGRPSSRRRRSCSPTQGYERTTVRDVAARAAIDPAMVMRYFGSKEGLFARATAFDLQLPDLTPGRAGPHRRDPGRALRGDLGGRAQQRQPDQPVARGRLAATTPRNAIRTIFGGQVVPMLARVVPPAELFDARRPGGDADHGARGHPLYPEGAPGGRHGPGAARASCSARRCSATSWASCDLGARHSSSSNEVGEVSASCADGGVMGHDDVVAYDPSVRFADTSPRVAWGGSATEWRAPSNFSPSPARNAPRSGAPWPWSRACPSGCAKTRSARAHWSAAPARR